MNIQSTVEQPEIYILARCSATENQLMYCNERMEDIKQLAYPIEFDSKTMYDHMRFFKGKYISENRFVFPFVVYLASNIKYN